MGAGSSSSITQNVTNRMVNKSDMNLLNQNICEFVSKNITNSASTCASSAAQSYNEKIGVIVAKGPGSQATISSDSKQQTNITLKCLQQSLQQSNINNNIASSIMQELTKNISQDTMTKLLSDAQASAKTGFGSIGFAVANSDVNTNITNENLNYTDVRLDNLIKNSVTNITQNSNVNDCATKISQNLSREIGAIAVSDGGVVTVVWTNDQIADSIANCQQLTTQVADITNAIATTLGVKIDESNSQKTQTDSTAKSTATATVEGWLDALANLFGGKIMLYVVSAIVCCLIILSSVGAFFFMGSGSNSGSNDDTEYQNDDTENDDETGDETGDDETEDMNSIVPI